MAADVKTQTSVLRKNISDYPQCSLLETATNAIAKTLSASDYSAVDKIIVIEDKSSNQQ